MNVDLNSPDPNVRLRARLEDALRVGNNNYGHIEVAADDLRAILDAWNPTPAPSDAQVEAALHAWMANDEEYGDVAMRAALRAAAEVADGA